MIAAWMIYAVGVSTILALAAVAVEHGLRFVRRPGRWVIATAVIGAVLLPLVSLYMPSQPTAESAVSSNAEAASALILITSVMPRANEVRALDVPLLGLWLGVSALLISLLIATQARIARVTGRYRRDTVNGTAVLRSGSLGPAVVGWIKGSIVLPSWADHMDEKWRNLMVLHEREHLRMGDARLLFAAVLVAALLPWNLPLWWMVFRLRRAIELDCDLRVLRSGVDVRSYGALLLEVSRRRTRTTIPMIAFAVNKSFLSRRVDAMTQHLNRFRYPKALVSTLVGLVLLLLACELPGPTGVDDEQAALERGEFAGSVFSSDSLLWGLHEIKESDSLAMITEVPMKRLEIFVDSVTSESTLVRTNDVFELLRQRFSDKGISDLDIARLSSHTARRLGLERPVDWTYVEAVGDIPTEPSALDIYAVVNDSTLVRVPQEVVERLKQGRFLLTVSEQAGQAQIILEGTDGRTRAKLSHIPTVPKEQ